MAEEKFTKGPWRARQEFANRWRIEQIPQGDFLPVSVGLACSTVLEVGVSGHDTEANAHLFAAAPMLYEAAKEYMKAVDFRLNAQHAFRSDNSDENSRNYSLSIDSLRFAEGDLRAALSAALGGK